LLFLLPRLSKVEKIMNCHLQNQTPWTDDTGIHLATSQSCLRGLSSDILN
jgi:hypothetical protein